MEEMRPLVRMDEEVLESLRSWAKSKGYNRSRAWYELVKIGLEEEGVMDTNG